MKSEALRPATSDDLAEIDLLMCAAKDQIELLEAYCDPRRRPERIGWLSQKLSYGTLWLWIDADGIGGVLIAGLDDFTGSVNKIAYIIVAERLRGQRKVGPLLVQHAKKLAGSGGLEAEARNERSLRLLISCGFHLSRAASASGHPVLNWHGGANPGGQYMAETPSPQNSGENEE